MQLGRDTEEIIRDVVLELVLQIMLYNDRPFAELGMASMRVTP